MEVSDELPKSIYTLAIVNTLYGIGENKTHILVDYICYFLSFFVVVIQALIVRSLFSEVFGTSECINVQEDFFVRFAILSVTLFAMTPSFHDFMLDTYLVYELPPVRIEFPGGGISEKTDRVPSLGSRCFAGLIALWEIFVWITVFFIGLQYIMQQKKIGDLVQAAMAMNYINDIDNYAFHYVLSNEFLSFRTILSNDFKNIVFQCHVLGSFPLIVCLFLFLFFFQCK